MFNRIDFEWRGKQSAGSLALDMDLRIKTPFEQMLLLEIDDIGRCVMPAKQHRQAYSVDGTCVKAGDRKTVENNRNVSSITQENMKQNNSTSKAIHNRGN